MIESEPPAVRVIPEAADAFGSWEALDAVLESAESLGDGSRLLGVPAGGSGARFFRLRVEVR